MNSFALCQYLDWDSDFFGVRIARLTTNRLTEEILYDTNNCCASHNIDCVYFLADSDNDETIFLAENNGFHLVDLRMTFEKPITAIPTFTAHSNNNVTRKSEPRDIIELRQIARSNHRDTRFYFDRHFSRERCDELYATWIERSCQGFADAVFVADDNGKASGYITCHLREGNLGQIGLVGVGPTLQGKGMGTQLVNHAINWFAEQGMKKVTVVTQGRNVIAQRLYQKSGFLTQSVQLWYHKWCSK